MTVTLSVHPSGTAPVRLGLGLVTWARSSEFSIQFLHKSAAGSFGETKGGPEAKGLGHSCDVAHELTLGPTHGD